MPKAFRIAFAKDCRKKTAYARSRGESYMPGRSICKAKKREHIPVGRTEW